MISKLQNTLIFFSDDDQLYDSTTKELFKKYFVNLHDFKNLHLIEKTRESTIDDVAFVQTCIIKKCINLLQKTISI